MPQVKRLIPPCIAAAFLAVVLPSHVSAEEREGLERVQSAYSSLFPDSTFHEPETKHASSENALEVFASSAGTGRIALEVRTHVEPNAFALPADRMSDNTPRIIIHSALLDALASHAELAFVLAHELSHLRNDHFRAAMPAFTLTNAQLRKIVAVEHEWEMTADREAIELLSTRGIDPRGAISLLGKLRGSAHADKSTPFRTHPGIQERITQIHQKLTQAALRP